MDIHASDFLTIALLVLLEGLLSADNALVLAILVLGLPRVTTCPISTCGSPVATASAMEGSSATGARTCLMSSSFAPWGAIRV